MQLQQDTSILHIDVENGKSVGLPSCTNVGYLHVVLHSLLIISILVLGVNLLLVVPIVIFQFAI